MPDTLPAQQLTDDALSQAVTGARDALVRRRQPDGHWVFELEADATIPAEYVLLEHFLDRIDETLEQKIGVYLRAIQGEHGGWPLFHDGAFDLSASVKAYYALKAIGDDPDAPHMARAREAILAAGGAERTNVFTRAQLALFGQVPWRAVPVMPLEIMHLPLWFPFHLSKVSYWSRTVIVPLLVLMALRPVARNPRGVQVAELFRTPPEQVRDWIRGPYRSAWGRFFKCVDSLLRAAQPFFPRRSRDSAIRKAVGFVATRLNGEDGLGGIYPAIANSVMMFDTLGYPPDQTDAATAWQAVRKLLVVQDDRAYCQPCLSPVWDTSLAGHALAEAGEPVEAACDWLRGRQILDVHGDWSVRRPGLRPGGWAFQVLERPLPRRGRHRRGRHAAAPPGRPGARPGAGPGQGMDRRHAVTRRGAVRWRLGGVRAGKHSFAPEPHPLRRSRRAARPAHRRRHRPLRLLPCPARHGRGRPGDGARFGLPAPRAGTGRQLVRPLGHQLHLRHLVGAVRAQRRRRAGLGPGGAPGGGRGWCRCSGRTAAGARTRKPTPPPRTAATRRVCQARPPGRCWA